MATSTGTQPIETALLLLRRFRSADAETISQSPGIYFWDDPLPVDLEETKRRLERIVGAYGQPGFYCWAVAEKKSGRCVGRVSLLHVDGKSCSGETACRIAEVFRGRGFGTEAVKAVSGYAFGQIGLHRVEIGISPCNAAAIRVLQKCGFVYEGRQRDYFPRGGGLYESRLCYSLLESEWA